MSRPGTVLRSLPAHRVRRGGEAGDLRDPQVKTLQDIRGLHLGRQVAALGVLAWPRPCHPAVSPSSWKTMDKPIS